jgi:regulator of protease activity HflC (stomatin/prohibitin superfamily)
MRSFVFGLLAFASMGCGAVIEPGHRGLLFNSRDGGLKHEPLQPGYHYVGFFGRVEDFDVTYSTAHIKIRTSSAEGLTMDMKLAVIYRPVQTELYELDTEIGPNYYDEVVGPEFASAARGVMARHSYLELAAKNEKIEDEVEAELRHRIHGKHVEISSITMESIEYAPEIAAAVRAKLVGEQEAARQKSALENEALRKKLELQHAAEQAKLEAEQMLLNKQNERAVAEQQAIIEKVQSESEAVTRVTHAKAEAEERILLAKAAEAEKKADARTLTPLTVMMHAYDALGKLGGEGTTIWLGDWSRVPSFLFPRGALAGPMGVASAVDPYAHAPNAGTK